MRMCRVTVHNHIGRFSNRNVWYLIAIFKIIQHLTFSCIQPQEASPLKNSPSIVFFCFFPVENGREPNETLKRVLLSRVCGYRRGAERAGDVGGWSGDGGGSLLHVTLQQEHDGRVALRRLFELFQRDLVVVVLIHFAEDLVHPLLWCQTVLVHLHHDHSSHHFVDRLRGGAKLAEHFDLLCNTARPSNVAWTFWNCPPPLKPQCADF